VLLALEVIHNSYIDNGRFWMYMNNDVFVTPRWASNMLKCIQSDPSIGLVMPVTNRSASFLEIGIPYDLFDRESSAEFGERYNNSNEKLWEDKTILYAFVGLNRPSARRSFGYYEDAYYYPFYYADGDISHSMKLAGYRLILAHDTFVHHLDGGTSVWKNRRVMLDRGESDFFNKFGYFPTDLHHIFPFSSVSGAPFAKVLLLEFSRCNPADEIIHYLQAFGISPFELYATDTCEKFAMENINKKIKFEKIDSWYDIDKAFGDITFDIIIMEDDLQTIRNIDKFLEAVKKKLSHNGQFVCTWGNPINIQTLRYFYMSGRNSMRDACRLIKKSFAPTKDLENALAKAGLFMESSFQGYNREDFYIYGVNLCRTARSFGVTDSEINVFVNRLKDMFKVFSIRNWKPIDDENMKKSLRAEI
jgi:SAM-dependent methyltransferase